MSEAELKALLLDGLRQIAPEADPATLRGDQNIRETLDIDSFDFLSFLIAVHDKLGVEIPEADYGKLNTLDAMLRYLGAKV
ncbi:acyl carrier protein [Prosthecobacter sp.]|jgi:acyl carrier protein|uniref:acyl carrier protein n=1 Tax=Prosthecobacter sp. TaxID=1965333 RepID=UPI0037843A03